MKTTHATVTSITPTTHDTAHRADVPTSPNGTQHGTEHGTEDSAGRAAALEPTLTLTELAAQLHVSVQTLYDLRSQGRGPAGFRVGRRLRFRLCEIEAWLARLEAEDAAGTATPGGA